MSAAGIAERMHVRIKICGMTRAADAAAAVRAGADAIGMVFWTSSPRAVARRDAASLTAALPPLVARVGVFVNESPESVAACVGDAGLSAVQLHGDEDVDRYRSARVPLIRAMSLLTGDDVARAMAMPADVTLLIDAHDPARRGGTGVPASWELAAVVAAARPIILAGGLTPANVGGAIRQVRPWAVDVSSGVESAPGVKDVAKMEAFVAAVRSL